MLCQTTVMNLEHGYSFVLAKKMRIVFVFIFLNKQQLSVNLFLCYGCVIIFCNVLKCIFLIKLFMFVFRFSRFFPDRITAHVFPVSTGAIVASDHYVVMETRTFARMAVLASKCIIIC